MNRMIGRGCCFGFLLAGLWLALSGCAATGGSAAPGGETAAASARSVPALRPRAVAGGWLFSYRPDRPARSVHLAGEFNGWSLSAWPMSDDDRDGTWTLTVPLETGRSYQYKYVVDGTEWVTDPFAEATDPNNYNNGILVTRRPGEAYLASFRPEDGARLAALDRISALVERSGRTVTAARITLSDYMGRRHWTLPATLDAAGGELSAPVPADLPDGDYLARFEVELAGAAPLTRTTAFLLDRWTGTVSAPAFYDTAVVYEIFVRSFRDGRGGDGIGDFEGLTASLDYLNDGDPATTTDLGVDALWLMPVHPSPSYHGYDITDYEAIEEDYGNLEDYRRFVVEAHRRGMRVILDFVVNHSSNEHPFFQDALGRPESPYSAWYKFTDAGQTAYTGFAGYGGMPELNFRSAEMRAYLSRMARFWVDLDGDGDLSDGVDGFRFDVAKGPPHDYWRELRRETKAWRPDFLLLGEVWDNAATIASYFHDQFDMNFDYPLYYATLELLDGRKEAVRWLRDYATVRDAYPAGAQLVRFLDNHDNNRIASILGGDPARQKLATGLLMALPGTPLVYYGMEVGMEGMKPDPDIRKPMRWDLVSAQTDDPASLLSWHRRLIRLRRELPPLAARDDVSVRTLIEGRADDPALLVFQRRIPGEGRAVLVVANPSGRTIESRLVLTGGGALTRGRLTSRESTGVALGADGTEVDLGAGIGARVEPWGFGIFEIGPR